MRSTQYFADNILLKSNKHTVLIFLFATTKGINGTDRGKDCHGVVFMVTNDVNKIRNCEKNLNHACIIVMIFFIIFFYIDYYWDPFEYQIADKKPISMVIDALTKMKNGTVNMGFGSQVNTKDCLKDV